MKKENILFFALVGGSLILVFVLLAQANKRRQQQKTPTPLPPNTGIPAQATQPTTTNQPPNIRRDLLLYKNIQGAELEVKELQTALNTLGKSLQVDGKFGSATETALVQTTNGDYNQITLNAFYLLTGKTAPNSTGATNQAPASGAQSVDIPSVWYAPWTWGL